MQISRAIAEATLTLREAANRMRLPYPTAQAYRLGRRTAQAGQMRKVVAFLRAQARRLVAAADRLEAEAERDSS